MECFKRTHNVVDEVELGASVDDREVGCVRKGGSKPDGMLGSGIPVNRPPLSGVGVFPS
jgi:hypothetical protein